MRARSAIALICALGVACDGVDTMTQQDAGATMTDAGMEVIPRDAGTPDAGLEHEDAGPGRDAGSPGDAGATVDAGSPVDAGAPADAGHASKDAGQCVPSECTKGSVCVDGACKAVNVCQAFADATTALDNDAMPCGSITTETLNVSCCESSLANCTQEDLQDLYDTAECFLGLPMCSLATLSTWANESGDCTNMTNNLTQGCAAAACVSP